MDHGTKSTAPRFAVMTQNDKRSSSVKPKFISTLRARGATLRGPTLAILIVSLAMAALAMALLLTKFYTANEPRRVFHINGVEIADSKTKSWSSTKPEITAVD
jgi:hypothetical protein